MIFKPHDYQRYCIQRMLQEEALALFLGMGLGKTVTTLTVEQHKAVGRPSIPRRHKLQGSAAQFSRSVNQVLLDLIFSQ